MPFAPLVDEAMRATIGAETRSLESALVARHTSKTRFGRGWFAGLAAAPLAIILAGCAPEGTGTLKVGSPAGIRAKREGSEPRPKNLTEKQAKALEEERKIPKLD
jgi:hypothetical protein